MSWQEGVFYLLGVALISIGAYFTYGFGYALSTAGVFIVFLAIFGEWED